jgi:acetyl-CoA carboxylase / biotin carboxylase 1
LEKDPPSIAKPDAFKSMQRAARRLTQSIGYFGAGTVEYLYNAATDGFFFLELNPRLQVEHPAVIKGITGFNLPTTQLQVAMGIPLYNTPEIRRSFGRDMYGTSRIDFMTEDYQPIESHIIAARITAENPQICYVQRSMPCSSCPDCRQLRSGACDRPQHANLHWY